MRRIDTAKGQGLLAAGWNLAFGSGSANRPRTSEWMLLAYFLYASVLALSLDLPLQVRILALASNAVALTALHIMAWWEAGLRSPWIRNILPVGCILLAYREMGWFAQPRPNTDLELSWVRWDRLLLDDWALQQAVEALGPIVPSLLELLYVGTYLLGPIGLLILAKHGQVDMADRFLALYVGSALAAYMWFPFLPSGPPREVFPEDLVPHYQTVFRAFNEWILGSAGIHTSVFPSGHVSSAFGFAFGLRWALPEHRSLARLSFAVAVAVALSTVYGRYHYAVDAVAGFAVSCVVAAVYVTISRRSSTRTSR